MLISQEQAFLKPQAQLHATCCFVERAATNGQRIDQAERELFSQLLAVGLTLIEAFVAAHGDGDAVRNSKPTTICSTASKTRTRGVSVSLR